MRSYEVKRILRLLKHGLQDTYIILIEPILIVLMVAFLCYLLVSLGISNLDTSQDKENQPSSSLIENQNDGM